MSEILRKRLLELDGKGKSTFAYKRAAETNVAATFAKFKKQIAQTKPEPASSNVKQMKKRGT